MKSHHQLLKERRGLVTAGPNASAQPRETGGATVFEWPFAEDTSRLV